MNGFKNWYNNGELLAIFALSISLTSLLVSGLNLLSTIHKLG